MLHDGLEELVLIFSLKRSLKQSKQRFSGISPSLSFCSLLWSSATKPAPAAPRSDWCLGVAVPGFVSSAEEMAPHSNKTNYTPA